jgi:hypothetical protein
MRRSLTRWDLVFFGVLVIGIAAATFHFFGGRPVNGALAIAAVLLGLALGITSLRQPSTPTAGANGVSGRHSPHRPREETDDRDSWLREAIISGFIATIVMSGVMVGSYLLAGIFADEGGTQIEQWFWNLTHNTLTDSTWDVPIAAYSLNLFAGIFWAVIYGWFFVGRLPGRGWQRGLLFSIVPWLLSLVVFFPLVGAGFFGLDLDAGPLPALGNLVLHLVYGVTLGIVYALPERAATTATDADAWATRWENRGMAVGLVTGLTTGVIVGAVMGLFVDEDLLGPTELLLIGAAIGTMIGALVGPFAGLQVGARDQPRSIS